MLMGTGYSWWMEVTLEISLCLGEPPFWLSMDGAGLRVTELVCEMRWLKFGRVGADGPDAEGVASLEPPLEACRADAAAAAAPLSKDHGGCGDWGKAGLVGVMRPGARGGERAGRREAVGGLALKELQDVVDDVAGAGAPLGEVGLA